MAGARVVLILGALYAVVGIVFGALAGRSATLEMRVAWRWAAWLVSLAAFAAHIGYEQVSRHSSPAATAWRVSSATAIGAFGLALAAVIHAVTTHQRFPAVMLVVWPGLTALPSFVVAWVSAAVLSRVRRRA